MVSRFIRLLLPILIAVPIGGGGLAIYAQSADGQNQQTRNVRESQYGQPRTAPSPKSNSNNSVAGTVREMQSSLQKLPWTELSPAAQKKIKSIAAGGPLFHRMPQQTVAADPEICHFLIRHPEVVIGMWEHLGDTQLSLREVQANYFALKETNGTTATVEVMYRTDDLCIAYARGEYRGPLLAKAYQGDVLLILRTRFTRDDMNEPMVVSDLDTFVQIGSLGADVLAKLFFTSLTKVADGNFEVTISFLNQVSRAANRNPEGLKSTVEEIPSIRQEVYTEFCDVVDRAALRYARRNQLTSLQNNPQDTRRSQYTGQTRTMPGDVVFSLTPPAHWNMDHLIDSAFSVFDGDDEMSMPKPLRSHLSENTVPLLPKPEK